MRHFCVLHIGKTAGTALKAVITQHKAIVPGAPIDVFPHETTMAALCESHPDSGIVFFVREPIARFVSGFNSRLRQGRPRYQNPWSEDEAHAFALFPTANALGEALDPDVALHGEARDAMDSIYHARLDLAHYLHSVAFLEAEKVRIAFIGETGHFDTDLPVLQDLMGIDRTIQPPRDPVGAHINPSDLDRTLSSAAQANLKRWYAKDLRIYDWCLAHRQALLIAENPA